MPPRRLIGAPGVDRAIFEALRAGLGVEDMAVRGIASPEQSRALIGQLRAAGLLAGMYRREA